MAEDVSEITIGNRNTSRWLSFFSLVDPLFSVRTKMTARTLLPTALLVLTSLSVTFALAVFLISIFNFEALSLVFGALCGWSTIFYHFTACLLTYRRKATSKTFDQRSILYFTTAGSICAYSIAALWIVALGISSCSTQGPETIMMAQMTTSFSMAIQVAHAALSAVAAALMGTIAIYSTLRMKKFELEDRAIIDDKVFYLGRGNTLVRKNTIPTINAPHTPEARHGMATFPVRPLSQIPGEKNARLTLRDSPRMSTTSKSDSERTIVESPTIEPILPILPMIDLTKSRLSHVVSTPVGALDVIYEMPDRQ